MENRAEGNTAGRGALKHEEGEGRGVYDWGRGNGLALGRYSEGEAFK